MATKDWITPTENPVTHQQSPHRQIPEINRQKQTATRRHVQETQDTFLQSHRRERQKSRQSSPTADREESTVVSDKQSLPQHPDDYMNITKSAIWKTSLERCYNIRSWLTSRKEDTVVKLKQGWKRVAGKTE